MIQLDNLKMSKKMLILVIIGILGILCVGYIGITSSGTINAQLNELYEIKYIHTVQSEDALIELLQYAKGTSDYITELDKEKMEEIENNTLEPAIQNFNNIIVEYEALGMTSEGKQIVDEIKKSFIQYTDASQKVLELSYEGNNAEAVVMRNNEVIPKRIKIEEDLKKLVDLNNQSAYQFYTESDVIYGNIILSTILVTIIAIIILLLISWYITRNLTRRFTQILSGMSEVGSGNLSYRILMSGSDELSSIGSSFDQMAINLEKQTNEIQENLEKSKRANNDIILIAEQIRKGNLNALIHAENYDGEFRILVKGVNDILQAFIAPLKEAMRIANEFAACNFAVKYDPTAHVQGDFEKFKDALNYSSTCVSDTIKIIQEQLVELTSNAEEANASTEEVAASAKTLADSAGIVSQNAERSNIGVNQVLKAMDDLTTTVNQVATRTDQVSKLTSEADNLSKEGAMLASVAEKGMQGITTSTEESREIISDIRSQMEEIGNIVGLIRDISDQTSLLALNAAIEAARAGDAGLGFAVVADEVKALAQETQKSAENIAHIIENLQKHSIQAAEAMEKTSDEVTEGGKALGDTLNSFNRIVELIDNINQNVADVAAASEEQAASVEEITASIHEVGMLVSDTTKEAEQSAHSSNEAAAAVNQISDVVNNLNTIVEQVQNQVRQFTI